MKRHLLIALLFCFAAVPLFAARRSTNIVDDVIRMQKAGVAEDEIIAFVHKGESRMDVTADDMIALHDAGVSRNVIKAVLDESGARGERRDRDGYRDGYRNDYAYSYSYAPRVVYGYYGVPYFYDPYWYDPWYGYGWGSRVSIGFNFGWGGYWGGYRPIYRGGGHGGGHSGGGHRGHR